MFLGLVSRHYGWGSSTQKTLNHGDIVNEVFDHFQEISGGKSTPGKDELINYITTKYPTLLGPDRVLVANGYGQKRREWRAAQK